VVARTTKGFPARKSTAKDPGPRDYKNLEAGEKPMRELLGKKRMGLNPWAKFHRRKRGGGGCTPRVHKSHAFPLRRITGLTKVKGKLTNAEPVRHLNKLVYSNLSTL